RLLVRILAPIPPSSPGDGGADLRSVDVVGRAALAGHRRDKTDRSAIQRGALLSGVGLLQSPVGKPDLPPRSIPRSLSRQPRKERPRQLGHLAARLPGPVP